MRIKTYILNLPKDRERKEYMQHLLQPYTSLLDSEFIEAVYGKTLTSEELEARFDNHSAFKRYGRNVQPNEIGCTLSHREVFKKIVDEDLPYGVILEDDIDLKPNFSELLPQAKILMQTEKPTILLLSGGYVYYKTQKIKNLPIAWIYDAYYTHSYMINAAAAKHLLQYKADYVADDWIYLRKRGMQIMALQPHCVNQKRDGVFISNIWDDSHAINKSKMGVTTLCNYIKDRLIYKGLQKIGNWEPFE